MRLTSAGVLMSRLRWPQTQPGLRSLDGHGVRDAETCSPWLHDGVGRARVHREHSSRQQTKARAYGLSVRQMNQHGDAAMIHEGDGTLQKRFDNGLCPFCECVWQPLPEQRLSVLQ